MNASRSIPRRTVLAAFVAMPVLQLGARAQQGAPRRPTPAQSEGPFYPVRLPPDRDNDLLRTGGRQYTEGQEAWVEGEVLDTAGRPLAGTAVEIWQCDHDGHYHHPGDRGRADPAFQGYGRVEVDEQGRYRFRTIRPAPYSGRTPHIHVKVLRDARELLTTQLYVEGEPRNSRDFLWQRLPPADRALVTVPFVPAGDALRAHFPITIQTA